MFQVRIARLLNIAHWLITTLMTVGVAMCAEDFLSYTTCLGREEIFKVDLDRLLDDVDQSFWKTSRFLRLPVYHPVRPVLVLSQYFYCL